MRIGTYSLAIVLALGASTLGFAACGGNVTVATSGTGGHGAGGAQTTTTVTSTTGNATTTGPTSSATGPTSASATSSSGGGDPACVSGCAHLASCNLPFSCSAAGIDCTKVGNQYDCLANCFSAVPCAQIGFATYQTCMAQCASDGGPTDAGMPGASCQPCAIQKCQGEAVACAQDQTQTCQKWLMCVQPCNTAMPQDPTCATKCDAMFAAAKPLYQPLYACSCMNCSTECAGSDPCSHVGDGG